MRSEGSFLKPLMIDRVSNVTDVIPFRLAPFRTRVVFPPGLTGALRHLVTVWSSCLG